MTDEQLLDVWQAAKDAHANAAEGQRDEAFRAVLEAEAAATVQMGIKANKKRLERYPPTKPSP